MLNSFFWLVSFIYLKDIDSMINIKHFSKSRIMIFKTLLLLFSFLAVLGNAFPNPANFLLSINCLTPFLYSIDSDLVADC